MVISCRVVCTLHDVRIMLVHLAGPRRLEVGTRGERCVVVHANPSWPPHLREKQTRAQCQHRASVRHGAAVRVAGAAVLVQLQAAIESGGE